MPPGYHVELVASEPMIEEPILIDWDPDGRLWVVEQRGYMQDLTARPNEQAPLGRVSVLEDTDGDGKMDKKTVFMDGLILPRALKVLDHGVLIGEPPNLWLAHDTNGDLKLRHARNLSSIPTGRTSRNVEHNANSLTWALDNWMYTSEHNGYLRLKDGKFDVPADAGARPVGRDARTTPAASIATPTSRRCSSTCCRRATSCATRTSCARAAATSRCRTARRSTPSGQCGRRRGVNRGYQDGILRPDGR